MDNTIQIDNEVQIGGTNDQLNNTIPTATKIIDLEQLDTKPIELKNENEILLEGGVKKITKDSEKDSEETNSKDVQEDSNEDSTDDSSNIRINVLDNVEYNIDYIEPDDDKLIDIDKVNNQVDKYIDNYNSPELLKYKKTMEQIYQKYSNKKYKITITKPKVSRYNIKDVSGVSSVSDVSNYASRIVVSKVDKDNTVLVDIAKPLYIYYNEDGNLQKLKRNISNSRTELLYRYEVLISKLEVSQDDKKEFEKKRKEFIEQLEEYYTYSLYHKKINKIMNMNKMPLIIQERIELYNEKTDSYDITLNGNLYNVDKNVVDMVNKINSDKLTQFNNIMINLSGKDMKDILKDKKLKEEIKVYNNKKESNEIHDTINTYVKNQDTYIDYIVINLPSIS